MTAADPALAAELIRRAELDQQVRAKPGKTPADYDHWRAVDAANLAWLRGIVAAGGWPGIGRAGRAGAAAAWLLVQHADRDWRFQVSCLRLMRDALRRGDAELWQVGFLADRVLSSAGRPQLFGTQHPAAGGPALPVAARPLLSAGELTAQMPDLPALWRAEAALLRTSPQTGKDPDASA